MEIVVNLINQVLPVIMFLTGFYFGHYIKKHDEVPNIPKQIKEDIKEAKETRKKEKLELEKEKELAEAEAYLKNIDNYPYNQKVLS